MPCSLHFVEGDYSIRSIVGVGLRLIPGRVGAMRRVSGSNAERRSLIGWDGIPDLIERDEGEGAGGIVLGTDRGSGRGFQTPLAKARVGLESR